MNLPRWSVTPEAVRNSVSMFSLITGARAGTSFRNSGSVAARQRARGVRDTPVPLATNKTEERTVHIRTVDGNGDLRNRPTWFSRARGQPGIEYNRFRLACVISWI